MAVLCSVLPIDPKKILARIDPLAHGCQTVFLEQLHSEAIRVFNTHGPKGQYELEFFWGQLVGRCTVQP